MTFSLSSIHGLADTVLSAAGIPSAWTLLLSIFAAGVTAFVLKETPTASAEIASIAGVVGGAAGAIAVGPVGAGAKDAAAAIVAPTNAIKSKIDTK